jgi:hypothetical protein
VKIIEEGAGIVEGVGNIIDGFFGTVRPKEPEPVPQPAPEPELKPEAP